MSARNHDLVVVAATASEARVGRFALSSGVVYHASEEEFVGVVEEMRAEEADGRVSPY